MGTGPNIPPGSNTDRPDANYRPTRQRSVNPGDPPEDYYLGAEPPLRTLGGILLLKDIIFSFEPREAKEALEAWFDSAPTDRSEGWTADELVEHVRSEYSTFTWLLEPMLERTGFEIKAKTVSDNGIFASYTCIRR